jgi:hypothetical protein
MRASSGFLAFFFAPLALVQAGCDGPAPGTDGGVLPGTDSPIADAPIAPGTDAPATGDSGTSPMSPLVDPMCIDGMYRETLPNRSQSLDDLVSGYSSGGSTAFVEAVTTRRYPLGNRFLTTGRFSGMSCVDIFFSDRSSADRAFSQLSTLVHECGHAVDSSLSGRGSSTYVVSSDIELTCAMGDTTTRGGLTFARSRIRNDEYQPMRPACPAGSFRDCDFYADTYLNGNPDDATFEGGDQGFNMLFEELVQYVNSLATDYAIGDYIGRGGGSVSDRDGLLTFMWYVERYLRMARLMFPSAYEHLLNGNGGCWRDAILTVWGRAVLYLEATDGMGGLGIDDDAIFALVTRPELLEEIERLRTAEGCP